MEITTQMEAIRRDSFSFFKSGKDDVIGKVFRDKPVVRSKGFLVKGFHDGLAITGRVKGFGGIHSGLKRLQCNKMYLCSHQRIKAFPRDLISCLTVR